MTLDMFFKEHPRVAVALSGGVDSAYLAWAAKNAGCDVRAYFVKSQFQPRFEAEDVSKLAKEYGIDVTALDADILCHTEVTDNPPDRCYHCKKVIFGTIIDAAWRDGFELVADGTNASDDAGDRPGMRALRELGVRSPLRECGLTKADIRRRAADAGLFVWDKPSYACLATRTPTGEKITAEKLIRTENAENMLFELGFHDFRVRSIGDRAVIQVRSDDMDKIMSNRGIIMRELGRMYRAVTLDLEARDE